MYSYHAQLSPNLSLVVQDALSDCRLQEARLEVLQRLLKQREEHHQDLNTKRLDRLWAKKQEEKESRVAKIRAEHIKTIRKLTEKRRKVEGKLERRDIVNDYANYGSQTYAPLTRVGVFLDRGSEQFVVKNRYLSTYQGKFSCMLTTVAKLFTIRLNSRET